jgi:hypothetical protein
MTHWQNGLPCRSKPSWNYWRFAWEPHIFRSTISFSIRKMAWVWDALYHPSLATSTWRILRNWFLTRYNANCSCAPLCWWHIVVWPHGPERSQNFLSHLISLRPSAQFTMENELDSSIKFLGLLVVRKGTILATNIRRRPTYTSQYLNFRSNHPPHVKRGPIQSLYNRTSTTCQERQDLFIEIRTCDVISSSMVAPKVSLTRLLIPSAAVIWIQRKVLWMLCTSHMWRVFQRSSNI